MIILLLSIASLPLKKADSSPQINTPYWNADGNFTVASQNPFSLSGSKQQFHVSPWQNNSWAVAALANFPNGTVTAADAFAFNVADGVGHAWVQESRRVVDARSGVAVFDQGLGAGFSPVPISVLGRDTLLAYKIMRENTGVPNSLNSPDEDGILFDLFLTTHFPVNGFNLGLILVVDFYVHQECGELNGGCAQTNDTSANHRVLGHTHFFEWRIHGNLQQGVWVSDVVNLRWYLETSLQRAICYQVTGSDACSLSPLDGSLYGLSTAAETFGGRAGFALAYEYLLQPNDCGTRENAGNDFNHSLRIDNVEPGQIVEVNGWLGSGYLFNDSNDYYQFNISAANLSGNSTVGVTDEGAESIWLYAPGNPPILKNHVENTSRGSAGFTQVIPKTDSAGYWYLRVHISNGFGPYTFRLGLNLPPTTIQPSIAAICSLGSPLPPLETSWQVITVFGVVTVLIVVAGRISTRKPECS